MFLFFFLEFSLDFGYFEKIFCFSYLVIFRIQQNLLFFLLLGDLMCVVGLNLFIYLVKQDVLLYLLDIIQIYDCKCYFVRLVKILNLVIFGICFFYFQIVLCVCSCIVLGQGWGWSFSVGSFLFIIYFECYCFFIQFYRVYGYFVVFVLYLGQKYFCKFIFGFICCLNE